MHNETTENINSVNGDISKDPTYNLYNVIEGASN